MKTSTKRILAVCGAIIVGMAIYGAYQFPQVQSFAGSAVGTTFNTAKVAAINFSPSSTTATSTSLFNADDSDRVITDAFVTCTGASQSFTSVATLNFTAATGTVSGANNSNTFATAFNVTVATSSLLRAYTATSTYTQIDARTWNSGSYLNIYSNATNTAACTAGVHYLAS